MDKGAIKNFAVEARKILIKSAITEAGLYGVTKDGCNEPIQKGSDFEVYKTIAGTENRIYGNTIKKRANLVKAINEHGFEQVMEETAYTWFNRLIAIRFMEVNDYLPTRVRVLSSETAGKREPDIVTQFLDVDLNMTPDELENVQKAKEENRYDDAFRMLFIKQCNELNEILPGLFEKTDDYMELLLKISYTTDGVVRMLIDTVPEESFDVEREGQVEIIGWMYQYYNTEPKAIVDAYVKKGKKVIKDDMPAKTQIFTPDWIVRYLVENTVGRLWIEHLKANDNSVDDKTIADELGWKYYIPEAEQEVAVKTRLIEVRNSYKNMTPMDLKCIDPCMGSGHILVYMFDVLMDIYKQAGYSERDAAFIIMEENINGIDIDNRAYQLSYFALMMKGRKYNRRFFSGRDIDDDGIIKRKYARPNIYSMKESNLLPKDITEQLEDNFDKIFNKTDVETIQYVIESFIDAKEYGSIMNIEKREYKNIEYKINKLINGTSNFYLDSDMNLIQNMIISEYLPTLRDLLNEAEMLSNKYEIVVTNPPYLGNNSFDSKLGAYLKTYYADNKSDLFAAFIEKCMKYTKNIGLLGMVTMQSWMFLESYEKLRKCIIDEKTIYNMTHMENNVMGIAFGTVAFTIFNSHISKYKGIYNQIGMGDLRDGLPREFPNQNKRYSVINMEKFKIIDGNPIAYWLSDTMFDVFKGDLFSKYGETKKGVLTGNDKRFVRTWFEVDISKIGFGLKDYHDMVDKNYKWIPVTGGGAFRKWYGNFEKVVNMENDSYEIRYDNANNYRLRDNIYYFRESLSWSEISSKSFSVRYIPEGILFGNSGPVCFFDSDILYFAGLLNSRVSLEYLKLLSPTMTFGPEQIKRLPVKVGKNEEVEELVKENIAIAKEDWDSTEYSWEFKMHPWLKFIQNRRIKISECDELWTNKLDKSVEQMKKNESRLNQLFTQIYGLTDDIAIDLSDEDITLRRKNDYENAVSFVSYVVGCMLGRYSIEKEGIICAGQDTSGFDKLIIKPDNDNIIPITEEEYFDDDIVGKFVEFVKNIFGAEYIEINLEYIAKNLKCQGNTAREKIRNYFIRDFYKNHCITFSGTTSGKKPIYWLFDSGKQNGFKALIYMHRYDKDTVGRIRADYLHKTQGAIEGALKNAEYIISSSTSAVDRAKATKDRDKYIKQLNEIKLYDQALAHVALQRIEIDLDNGVKHNYQLFQGVEVSSEGSKKQSVDLLAKI